MNSGSKEVEVHTLPDGTPSAVRRDGRLWVVGVEPISWFERTPWWQTQRRMPKGQGRVDVQVWRVQARLGRNARSDLVTMDLECDSGEGPWRLRDPELHRV